MEKKKGKVCFWSSNLQQCFHFIFVLPVVIVFLIVTIVSMSSLCPSLPKLTKRKVTHGNHVIKISDISFARSIENSCVLFYNLQLETNQQNSLSLSLPPFTNPSTALAPIHPILRLYGFPPLPQWEHHNPLLPNFSSANLLLKRMLSLSPPTPKWTTSKPTTLTPPIQRKPPKCKPQP